MFCDSLREYVDRPVELEDVRCPDYLAKWEFLATIAAFPKVDVCMYTLMSKVDMYTKD